MEKLKGIVRANTEPKEWNGQIQIGFTLEADSKKWYNISGEEEELKKIKDTLLKKGNEIEFDFDFEDTGQILNLKVVTAAKEGGKWEDDIIDFKTLLNAAHDKGAPFSIKTEKIELDLEKKYALFKATVEVYATAEQYIKYCIGEISEESKHHKRMKLVEFTGHGDATEENVTGEFIKPHFIRMAETRAICRALRWYTNNATCSEEEKSEEKDTKDTKEEKPMEVKTEKIGPKKKGRPKAEQDPQAPY